MRSSVVDYVILGGLLNRYSIDRFIKDTCQVNCFKLYSVFRLYTLELLPRGVGVRSLMLSCEITRSRLYGTTPTAAKALLIILNL